MRSTSSVKGQEHSDTGSVASPSVHPPTNNCRNSLQGWWFLNTETGEVVPVRCGRWTCPECGKRKRRRWERQAAAWARAKGLRRFATLTLDRSRIPEGVDLWDYLQGAWARLRTKLVERYGEAPSYVGVRQLKGKDHLHVHCLFDRYIHQPWLKGAWIRAGGGSVVDIRWVDEQGIAGYLARYFGGNVLDGGTPKGRRRFSTSRDIAIWRAPDGTEHRSSTGKWRIWKGGNTEYGADEVLSWAQRVGLVSALPAGQQETRSP